jgi:hypothetical protein
VFRLKKKIFFFITRRLISIKLATNHPQVKGILICTNQGPGPFQKEDNHKDAKTGWGDVKIFFSQTTELEELIFTSQLSNMM